MSSHLYDITSLHDYYHNNIQYLKAMSSNHYTKPSVDSQ